MKLKILIYQNADKNKVFENNTGYSNGPIRVNNVNILIPREFVPTYVVQYSVVRLRHLIKLLAKEGTRTFKTFRIQQARTMWF